MADEPQSDPVDGVWTDPDGRRWAITVDPSRTWHGEPWLVMTPLDEETADG